MSTLKVTQRFIALLVLVAVTLTGCGINLAPAAEQQVITIEAETGGEDQDGAYEPPATADHAPGSETTVSDSTEKPMIVEYSEIVKEEAALPSEPATVVGALDTSAESDDGYVTAGAASGSGAVGGEPAVAATPLALPTASPRPADLDGVAGMDAPDSASEMERRGDDLAVAKSEEKGEGLIAPVQQSQPLKAGEVDDNAQWDEYLLYRRDYRGPRVHERDISERYIVEVVDGQGRPILGAKVSFFLPGLQRQELYSGRTYANGQILFQPLTLDLAGEQVNRFTVEVQKDNVLQQFSLTRFDAQAATSFTDRWTVTLDRQSQQSDSLNLDVLFLIDATGSMADEIAKIQSTIFDVSARVDALPESPNVRYGLVSYRDRDDAFVTNSYDFTPDVRDFAANLNTVFADGGGDYPEALNEGLHDALHSVEWRGEDTVQLIFLIADAPPHLDYAQDYDYAVEMETAAQRGIKIFPIASSGLDDQGEYIFRQMAQFTQGRFIFLTYEGPTNGGAPGETTTHHVDDYSVENLDDLLVELVKEELAHQNSLLVRVQ